MNISTINIVDIIIILFILIGGIVGFKEGVLKKLVSIIGLILVVVVAFILKNKLSIYFYENLPFFDLWGVFKGVQILNVIFYEMVAFLLIASLLMLVYRLLLAVTGLIEKILKATVILGIPSKILGFIVGLLEAYIWVYIFLFVLTLPMINIKEIYTSKTASFIMEETPYLSKYTDKTKEIYTNLYNIIDNRQEKTNKEVNEEAIDLMLKYDIITPESVQKLIDSNKVSVSDDYVVKKG